MNPPDPDAFDAPLRSLLREARPSPALPFGFAEGVRRRLARTEADLPVQPESGWLERLVDQLLRPRLAMAGLLLMILIGTMTGWWNGQEVARHTAQARYLAAVTPHP